MDRQVSIEQAAHDLEELVDGLRPGETVTLVGVDGKPCALVVSVTSATSSVQQQSSAWLADLDRNAADVDAVWSAQQSAVDLLSSIRR